MSVDPAAAPQPLFSVLGGAVTRALLAQAQRDVDTLCLVSAALAAPSPAARAAALSAGAQTSASAQRLLRVVEGLGAPSPAHGDAEGSSTGVAVAHGKDAGEETDAMAPALATSSAPGAVRDALINVYGVAEGSALYRECVQAPRRRLHRVVRQLASTVRARCLPILAHPHAGLDDEDAAAVDVHVQLYPSSAVVPRCAVPEPLRAAQGFCAAVTVRRLSALQAEAAAAQELRARYMRVAALGQTLTTTLDFWADVSYGDAPPPALVDFPPLGFEEAADAAGRQRGRKAPRRDGHDTTEEGATSPPLVLGMRGTADPTAHTRTAASAVTAARPPAWVQPPCLALPSPSDTVSGRQRAAAATTPSSPSRLAPLPPLHYDAVGLLAAVYVHGSGVAYVGYPSAPVPGSANGEVGPAANAREDGQAATAAGMEPAVVRAAPVCVLPMSSTTGFVRSLLGLS